MTCIRIWKRPSFLVWSPLWYCNRYLLCYKAKKNNLKKDRVAFIWMSKWNRNIYFLWKVWLTPEKLILHELLSGLSFDAKFGGYSILVTLIQFLWFMYVFIDANKKSWNPTSGSLFYPMWTSYTAWHQMANDPDPKVLGAARLHLPKPLHFSHWNHHNHLHLTDAAWRIDWCIWTT